MSEAVAAGSAERAVATLAEMSADLRACAIVGPGGDVLASSGDGPWGEVTGELWDAAAAARPGGEPATQVHVANEDGELFAARADGLTAVAITDRFALASLMFCDLRAVLRDLSGAAAS